MSNLNDNFGLKAVKLRDYQGAKLRDGEFAEYAFSFLDEIEQYPDEVVPAKTFAAFKEAFLDFEKNLLFPVSFNQTPIIARLSSKRSKLFRLIVDAHKRVMRLETPSRLRDAAFAIYNVVRPFYNRRDKISMTGDSTHASAITDQLLGNEKYADAIDTLGFRVYLEELKEANDSLKKLFRERNCESGTRIAKRNGKVTKDFRKIAADAFSKVILALNASSILAPSEAKTNFMAGLMGIQRKFREIAKHKNFKSSSTDEKGIEGSNS
ncbi:MAG: hypothetical protein IJQ34_01625 [Kiritimatiellae bacterium]|nr:hypothetical protein [Kiritimatiellia bacterium]